MVIDSGNAETEALLIDAEREIHDIYSRAAKETQEKLEDYLRGFERRDARKKALVESGKMSEDDYTEWRKNQILTGERWKNMVEALTEDHVNADKLAMSTIRGHLPEAYAINANYATYEVEKGTGLDTTFTLYDRQTVERLVRDKPDLLPQPKPDIPADKRWNRQHIRNEITQSILQGEDTKQTAKRLQRVTDMDDRAAIRNARTAMTGAQNAGRIDSYKRAEAMGIKMHQQWVAALDSHTRHEHRDADGQTVKVGEPFEIDGYELEYPGDPTAPGYLIYNCRCRVIADLKDFEFDPSAISLGYDERLEDMTYQEWKDAHGNTASNETTVNIPSGMDEEQYKEWQEKHSSAKELERKFEEKYGISAEQAKRGDDYIDSEKEWSDALIDKEVYNVVYNATSFYGDGCGYVQCADGSKAINAYLRKGEKGAYSIKEMKTTMDALDKLIDVSEIDGRMVVDRWAGIDALEHFGVSVPDHSSTFRIGHSFCTDGLDFNSVVKSVRTDFIGAEIVDKGYMSASACSTLNVFRGSDVKFSLIVPKGTKAYITDNIAESEIVFAPGTRQVIRDVKIIDTEAVDYEGNKTKRQAVEIIAEIVG